jgi:plastocyanin
MKRLTPCLVLAAALLLVPLAPAQALTQSVDITGGTFGAYSPATKPVVLGDKVKWTNKGSAQHTSTGDAPLSLWSSPALSPPTGNYTTTVAFTAAGTYPYHCVFHSNMHGNIQTPLALSKAGGLKISLKLSTVAADATHKFVVQRKNGANFVTLATVTTPTYVFTAPGAGTYTFRSALQKNGTTATAAFFSAPKSITVP